VTKLSSVVVPGDLVEGLIYEAVEKVLDAADRITYNGYFFVDTADLLQGATGLSAVSLAGLLRGTVHGGLAVAPTLKDDGFRQGLAFLIEYVNAAGRFGGLTTRTAFENQDPGWEVVKNNFDFGGESAFMRKEIRAGSLYQKNARFKFCSRVAGGDRFVYWKRS